MDYYKFFLAILIRLGFIIPDRLYVSWMFFLSMKKRLNLKDPKTFSEKIQWLKLYNRCPEYTDMVDKIKVKNYVEKKLGKEYIIPTLGIWSNPEDIDFETLPEQFVLKCNHNSGAGIFICKNKSNINENEVVKSLKKALNDDYYAKWREWPYKNVHRKILAEKYIESQSDSDLKDYKFFCFNGEPVYCQVISGRGRRMCIDFFDKDWKHQEFHEPKEYPFAEELPQKPKSFDLMWKLAGKLALNIPFVRVDFYDLDGIVYFGEITFFPTTGIGGFFPDEWDRKFGDMIDLRGVL